MSQKPIPPTSSSDLKFQLGELQRKFAPAAVKGSRNKSEEPQIHLPPTLLNAKQQHGGIGQIKNTSSKTVDFLGDLSDGLLVESRRLAYENKQYKSLLQKTESDNTTLKKQLSNLNTVFEKSNAKEEELNDKNWELEVKIQQLQLTLDKTKNEYQSYKSKNSQSEVSKDNLKLSLDSLKLENSQLKESHNIKITSLNSELIELKESNENLNDENDLLHQKFISLKEDFDEIKAENDKLLDINRELQLDNGADTSLATFDDSIIQDPQLFPSTKEMKSLDNETLQRNLTYAYAIIKKLRSQNPRFKNASPRFKRSPSKSLQKGHTSNKNYETLVNNSLNDVDADSWENYQDDSFAKAIPFDNIPQLLQNNSDSNSDDDDLIDNYNNEFNLSDIVSSSSPKKIKSIASPKASEKYVLVVPSSENASINVENIICEYNSFQTISISESEYNDILSQSSTNQSKNPSTNIISSKYANNKNLKLFTNVEMNNMKEMINEKNDTIKHLTLQVSELDAQLNESKNLVTEIADAKQTEVMNIQKQLDSTSNKLKESECNEKEIQQKLTVLKEQVQSQKQELEKLRSQFDTPAIEYIKEKSKTHNFIAVPLNDYEILKNESSNIKLQIIELQHTKKQLIEAQEALKNTQSLNSGLTAKLYQLEETLDTVNKSLSDKNIQLQQLNDSIDSPDINYIKSKASALDFVTVPVSRYDELTSELDTLKNEHEALQNKLKSLTVDYSEANDQIRSTKEKCILLERQHVELNTQLESASVDIITKQKKILDFEILKSELAEAQSCLASTVEAKLKLTDELTDKNAELEIAHKLSKEKSTELNSLSFRLETPTLEYLKAKVVNYGSTILPVEEYCSLKEELANKESQILELTESKNNMHTEIDQKRALIVSMELELANLKTLKTDYDAQTLKFSDLQKEQAQLNKKVSEFENVQLDLAEVRKSLHFKENELTRLESDFRSPTAEYIKEKCSLHGLLTLPIEELDSMKSEIGDGKNEIISLKNELFELKDANEKLQAIVIENNKHNSSVTTELEKTSQKLNDLQTQFEKPTVDYLKAKAKTLGMVSISIVEIDELKQKIKNYQTENEDLQDIIESPSIEYLKLHCERINHDMLLRSEYSSLKQQLNVQNGEIALLKQKLDNPSTAYIKRMSSKNDLSVVRKAKYTSLLAELNELKRSIEFPDVEYIKEKACLHGLILLPVNEHENLLANLKTKDRELQSLIAVKVQLSDQLEKLKEKEVLLAQAEQELKSKDIENKLLKNGLENPEKDFIKSKASDHGLIVLPLPEHENLISQFDEAKIELKNKKNEILALRRLKEDLEIQGEKLISIDLHDTVQSELTLTKDKLHEVSGELASVNTELMSRTNEVQNLKADCTRLSTAAAKLAKVELELNSSKMHEKELEAVNRDYLHLQTEHNILMAKCEDLEKLEVELENTKNDYKDSCERLKKAEKSLQSPNETFIKEKSASLGLVTLSGTEYESLKEDLNSKLEELELLKDTETQLNNSEAEVQRLQKHNLDLQDDLNNIHGLEKALSEANSRLEVKEKELRDVNKTVAEPSFEYIKSNASKRGLFILPETEHDSNLEEIAFLKNAVEDVKMKHADLKDRNSETISENNDLMTKLSALAETGSKLSETLKLRQIELQSAKSQIEKPDADYIKSKTEQLGLVAVQIAEYENNKVELEKLASQRRSDLDSLSMKAAELEKTKCERDDLVTQLNQLKLKSADEIESKTKEFSAIKGLYENPSADYLKIKASNIGLTLLEVIEYQKMGNKISQLTKGINQKSQEIEVLQTKVETLEAPSKEYIETRSNAMGFIPVPIFEHKTLTSDLRSKNKMIEKLENDNKFLTEEFSRAKKSHEASVSEKDKAISCLQKDIEKPSIDYLESKSATFESLLVSKIDHQNLIDEVEKYSSKLLITQASIDEKNKEIKDQKTSLVTTNAEIDRYKCEIESFKHVLNSKENELETYKSSILEKSEEVENFERELRTLNEVLFSKDKEIDEHKRLYTEKNKEMEAVRSSLNVANENLAEVESTKASASKEIDELELKMHAVEEKLVVSHKISEKLAADKEDLLKKQQTHVTELQEQIARITSEHVQLKDDVALLNSQLLQKSSLLESFRKQIEEPDIEYIKQKSKMHNLFPISFGEYDQLNNELASTNSMLLDLRKNDNENANFQISEVSESNNQPIKIDKQLTSAETKAEFEHSSNSETGKVMVHEPTQADALHKGLSVSQSHTSDYEDDISEDSLEQLAMSRGFVLLPLPAKNLSANTMQKSSSIATITAEDSFDKVPKASLNAIIDTMDSIGYKCLPINEYESLISSEVYENFNVDESDIANVTLEAEDLLSQMETRKNKLKELTLESERSSKSSLKSSSRSSSISVHDVLHDKEAAIKAKKNSLTTHLESLKKKKTDIQKQINRVSVASFDSNSEPPSHLNTKLDKNLSKINDEIELAIIELNSQDSALLAVKAYIESAKGLNLPTIQNRNSGVLATEQATDDDDQLSVIQNEVTDLEHKYQEKVQELNGLRLKFTNPDHLVSLLKKLGYNVSKADSTFSDVDYRAESYITDSRAAIEPELRAKAAELGLALVPVSDVDKSNNVIARNETNNDAFSDLQWKSHELGYELIKIEDLDELKKLAQETGKIPEILNIVDLQMYANKLNVKLLSDDDIKQLKKRPITSKELADKAMEMNLVMMNEEEANELKLKQPITGENIIHKAKELGFLCVPQSQFIATTVTRVFDPDNVVVLPNSYYQKLLKSHELVKKNKSNLETLPKPVIPEDQSYNLPTSPSTMSISNIDATSLRTVNTIISNKQEIIAAVAQTIIGEYLYKYYRKLGPLSSIADTRHERYFWVHPYSLTLYWSNHNPVLADPGKTQIKAMSIVSVQSVDDHNPLPPGIYHKSLLVKSHDKIVKLTCPTRQRHNIWFNSLKYLIDKSTENWISDDSIEDQYSQAFQLDKKFELDRAHSMSFRHSQPKNVSFKSLEQNRRVSSVAAIRTSLRK